MLLDVGIEYELNEGIILYHLAENLVVTVSHKDSGNEKDKGASSSTSSKWSRNHSKK